MLHGTSHALCCFALGHPAGMVWDIPCRFKILFGISHWPIWWVGPLAPAREKKCIFGPIYAPFCMIYSDPWSCSLGFSSHGEVGTLGCFFFFSEQTAIWVCWPALEYQNMGTFAHAQILKHRCVCPCLDIKTQVHSPMLGYQNMGTFE
jgi:hypothetical protein